VTASATNATLSYSYSGLPPGCDSRNVSSLACSPTSTGSFNVTVTVTSSWGTRSSTNLTLEVAGIAPSISSFLVSPSSIYLGQTAQFTVQASGTDLSLSYSGLPRGCYSMNESTIDCTPSQTGNFTVNVTAESALGLSAHASVGLTVIAPPELVLVSYSATPTNLTLGNSTTITVIVAGSVGPPSFAYSGLPPGCADSNRSSLPCTPTEAGNFTIGVDVSDALKRTISAKLDLSVLPVHSVSPLPPPSGSAPALLGAFEIALIAAVGTVAAVVALALLMRRKRRNGRDKSA